jgi:hypothetical protein
MATKHALSGELINGHWAHRSTTQSTTLLQDERLKIMRLVMRAGKKMPDHAAPAHA